MSEPGRKADAGKARFDLVPFAALEEVVRVLEFGAAKYSAGNWRFVENARVRYLAAALRHISAWARGQRNDPESGRHHLAHAACCVLFLLDPEVTT